MPANGKIHPKISQKFFCLWLQESFLSPGMLHLPSWMADDGTWATIIINRLVLIGPLPTDIVGAQAGRVLNLCRSGHNPNGACLHILHILKM